MSDGGIDFRAKVAETREAMHSLFGGPYDVGARPGLPERLRPLPVTEPGFYRMTAAQYHADPAPDPSLSASFACELINTTPAHARLKHPRLNPHHVNDQAQHFDIGEVAHAAFLEGRDVVQILDFPDWRTKASQEAAALARFEGKVPLLRKVWDPVERMLAATRAQLETHEDGAAMFTAGIAEPVLVWREDGIWFRARIDWLRLSTARQRFFAIDDYKTTAKSADPEELAQRHIWNMGWDVKASFYRRGLYTLTGYGAEFRFAVQEIFEPFALSVLAPSPSAEMLGDMKVQIAINRWRDGLLGKSWPAYPRRTAYFEVPGWLEAKWEARTDQ